MREIESDSYKQRLGQVGIKWERQRLWHKETNRGRDRVAALDTHRVSDMH